MIRTYRVPCDLRQEHADRINLASGRIYSGIVCRHWRLLKQKGLWLSENSLTKLSDLHLANEQIQMHAHTIDAGCPLGQQGFFKACKTTRTLRKIGIKANFPWRSKKFRTTIWKNTAIKFKGGKLELSTGSAHPALGRVPTGCRSRHRAPKIYINLPESLWSLLRFVEVRLVFDKKAYRYVWHVAAAAGD